MINTVSVSNQLVHGLCASLELWVHLGSLRSLRRTLIAIVRVTLTLLACLVAYPVHQ